MIQFDHDSLIRTMVGRQISALYPDRQAATREEKSMLSVQGLQVRSSDRPVSFEVRAGEIVGLGGLIGAGRTEILRAIFGADPVDGGTVEVDGEPLLPGSPRRAVRAGLGLLSEDRKELGLLLQLSIKENVAIADMSEMSSGGVVSKQREATVVDRLLSDLRVRAPSYEQPVSSLSGGNQQ